MELEVLLAKVGLKVEYNCTAPDFHFWDDSVYTHYSIGGSSGSSEMDSAYRMYEGMLINRETGLRVHFLGTESYDGNEMSYRIIGVSVRAGKPDQILITDIDPERKIFIADHEMIPFENTLKEP